MMTSLISHYDKYKEYIVPGAWWKLNLTNPYRYRKISKIEEKYHCIFVYYKDSMLTSSYRLDYFLENHTPVTSRWEIFYAKLNHLTSGFFY